MSRQVAVRVAVRKAGEIAFWRPWLRLNFFYYFFPIAGSFTDVGKKY
jgi:hypothetical protein